MSDPVRISQRGAGLAAQLLRAGAVEQPHDSSMARTLTALGVSSVVLSTASVGAAASAGASVATAGAGAKAMNAVTLTLLAKWIGLGVVGGVSLAGAAAAVSGPAASSSAAPLATSLTASAPAKSRAATPLPVREAAPEPEAVPVPEIAPSPEAAPSPEVVRGAPRALPSVAPPEVGAPLAAEVAFVDEARAILASGRAEQGLALLSRYEQRFPESRLLPEVLFLRMETSDRLGRSSEARAAAERLVQGFPQSPHSARARRLLGR